MPRAIDLRQLEADYDPNRSGTEFHLGAYTSGFAEMWQKILAKVQEDLEASVIAALSELLGIDPAVVGEFLSMFDSMELDYSSPEAFLESLISAAAALPSVLAHLIESLTGPGGLPGVGDIIDTITGLIFGTLSGIGGAGTEATLPATLPFTLGGGGTDPLALYFANLRAFFTGIDFTDPDFDLADAINTFQVVVVDPQVKLLVDALTGIVNSTETDLDNWLLSLVTGDWLTDTTDGWQALLDIFKGDASGALADVIDRIQHLGAGTGQFDASELFNLANIPAIAQDSITDLVTDLTAAAQNLQDVVDTVWQSITRAAGVGNQLEDLFAALQNIPFLNVLGVGGPTSIGSALEETWNHLVGGLVGALGGSASLADLFNVGQDVSSRATLGLFSWDVLGIRNNKSLNTGFLSTSESNMSLDKVALQPSAPTFALTQSTAITAFQRISETADKGAVAWLGSGVTNITAAFVNIYQMDTTTGLSTLVHASADVAGLLSNTMQHNIYALPTALHVAPGEVYGIEICVRGSGTHSIVGGTTWLPAHPTVFPQKMSAVRNSGTSAAPATIAHSALAYSTNVPFVEFAVSAGDLGLPHAPQIDYFNAAGTTTRPIPSWCNFVQIIAVGGGGGGRQGGTVGFNGEGGDAGHWVTATWIRDVNFTGTPSIGITVGAGGAGGSSGLGLGDNGGTTTVSIPGHSVSATGGEGGDAVNLGGGDKQGRSPGNQSYDGIVYVGGVQQNSFGADGASPGGGGAGGNYVSFQYGGAGARGAVWLRFKQ